MEDSGDHKLLTPESLVQRLTLEQLADLFGEIGHQVNCDEMKELKSRVIEMDCVESAFQEFIDQKATA
ncbi:MAG: hypothetical protein L7U72_06810 [Rubripirellula sp.]|nr:hypothetical protein [Rubripirellula sp.]